MKLVLVIQFTGSLPPKEGKKKGSHFLTYVAAPTTSSGLPQPDSLHLASMGKKPLT